MLPPASSETPYGNANWPGSLPWDPAAAWNAPAGSNFSILWLSSSATTTSLELAASPRGYENWPGPLPLAPHAIASPPLRLKRWMRLLPESATYTYSPPTAIPPPGGFVGSCEEKKRNWPASEPVWPQDIMKLPLASNFSTRLWLESTT